MLRLDICLADIDLVNVVVLADAIAMIVVHLVLALTTPISGAWWSDTWQTAGHASQKVSHFNELCMYVF